MRYSKIQKSVHIVSGRCPKESGTSSIQASTSNQPPPPPPHPPPKRRCQRSFVIESRTSFKLTTSSTTSSASTTTTATSSASTSAAALCNGQYKIGLQLISERVSNLQQHHQHTLPRLHPHRTQQLRRLRMSRNSNCPLLRRRRPCIPA